MGCEVVEGDVLWQELSDDGRRRTPAQFKRDFKKALLSEISLLSGAEVVIVDAMGLTYLPEIARKYDVYTVFIYSNLKRVIANLKRRSSRRRVRDILGQWMTAYKRTSARDPLGTMSAADIWRLIESSRWEGEFASREEEESFYQRVLDSFDFRGARQIDIGLTNPEDIDIVINTSDFTPPAAARHIARLLRG